MQFHYPVIMLRTRTALVTATIVIAAGCTPTKVPSAVLQPVVTASSNDASIKSNGPWALKPSRQPHTYQSISQTTVYELSNPLVHENSIEVATTFTISLDQSQTPLI